MAIFKPNTDVFWKGIINQADEKYQLKNIMMAADFNQLKAITEINDKGELALKSDNLVPRDFIDKFYADKNRLIYFPAEIVDNVNRKIKSNFANILFNHKNKI